MYVCWQNRLAYHSKPQLQQSSSWKAKSQKETNRLYLYFQILGGVSELQRNFPTRVGSALQLNMNKRTCLLMSAMASPLYLLSRPLDIFGWKHMHSNSPSHRQCTPIVCSCAHILANIPLISGSSLGVPASLCSKESAEMLLSLFPFPLAPFPAPFFSPMLPPGPGSTFGGWPPLLGSQGEGWDWLVEPPCLPWLENLESSWGLPDGDITVGGRTITSCFDLGLLGAEEKKEKKLKIKNKKKVTNHSMDSFNPVGTESRNNLCHLCKLKTTADK